MRERGFILLVVLLSAMLIELCVITLFETDSVNANLYTTHPEQLKMQAVAARYNDKCFDSV